MPVGGGTVLLNLSAWSHSALTPEFICLVGSDSRILPELFGEGSPRDFLSRIKHIPTRNSLFINANEARKIPATATWLQSPGSVSVILGGVLIKAASVFVRTGACRRTCHTAAVTLHTHTPHAHGTYTTFWRLSCISLCPS